jgi:hypothetical protein
MIDVGEVGRQVERQSSAAGDSDSVAADDDMARRDLRALPQIDARKRPHVRAVGHTVRVVGITGHPS